MLSVFSRASCQPCYQLKKYLTHKGIDFKEFDVDIDENLNKMLKLTGKMIVPTVVRGDQIIVGLNYGALAKMLY